MERLTEKISEYIQCNNNECRLSYCDRECEHYKRMVNKLAEEYNNGWIPCSERMPEKTDDYLCQVGNWCMVLPYRKGQNAFLNKEGGPIDVVAWQPLPELYKETGDKNNI